MIWKYSQELQKPRYGTEKESRVYIGQFKRREESRDPHLGSNNKFNIFKEINLDISNLERSKERMMKKEEVRKIQVQKSLQLKM